MLGAPAPIVKIEHDQHVDNPGNNVVKHDIDPRRLSPAGHSEDDIYEDAGDLDFSDSGHCVYLARLPKFLWKSWSQIGDDEEIELGTVRVERDPTGTKRMSLLLSEELPLNQSVPKEYNLKVTNESTVNTFIFTEKDLPGYNNRAKGQGRQARSGASMPFSQVAPRLFPDHKKQDLSGIEKTKRYQPYFRKAIPKKTGIAGEVGTEINCLPVENDEYRRIMGQKTKEAMRPKGETQFLSAASSNLLAPGTLGATRNFSNFIVVLSNSIDTFPTNARQKTSGTQRGKPQEFKTARIPQNELMDLIFSCFRRYKYWPIKALKAELKQPEVYLKETLERVAVLVKQGTYAMTWQLMPSYGQLSNVKDEVAPDDSYGFDGTSDVGDAGEGGATDDDVANNMMKNEM